MATWHQLRSRAPLFHQTLWTVLIDPPGAPRSAMLFETQAEADGYAAKVPHSLVLPPANRGQQ